MRGLKNVTVNFTSFKQYLVEEEKTVYFTFGRMNPPTAGHGLILNALSKKANRNPYRVYVSQTNDENKNPLSYNEKVKYLRKMFPKQSRSIMMNTSVKDAWSAASTMHDEGFQNLVMVVGSDRVDEFDTRLKRYNGVKGKHGFYNFKTISVVSAGQRDPDSEGVQGASGTKQRAAAKGDDFVSFAQGLPTTMSDKDAKELFNAVRKGMGLKEANEFHNHVKLESVSDIREQFVEGNIFNVGDMVMITDIQEQAIIQVRGSNYLILEKEDGTTTRKWITSIEPIEERVNELGTNSYRKEAEKTYIPSKKKVKEVAQDSDIKDKEGTQPAKYYAGDMSKSTKSKRDAHFKKGADKDDNDNSAYKPAPGDADAKTEPSKHTKKFKQMYDEDCWDGYKQVGMKKKKGKNVPNCVPEDVNENTKGLKNKAEKSGMPVGILRKVYNRGVAAWRTGHRPGTTPQQWGMARVNSFVTKSSGTWGKADSDLAAKVKGK